MTLLPRSELARALHVSDSSIDRLVAAGHLKAAGHRGRQKLYRLVDGRRAQKTAANTDNIKAAIGWVAAQAEEARGHVWRLHTEWIHRDAWRPHWRAHVAAVRSILTSWAATSAAELAAVIQEPARVLGPTFTLPTGARACGVAVQESVRPLLERLAAVPGTWPAPPDRPAPGVRSETITAAREALVAARTAWAELRTRVKTEPGWRTRRALERARDAAVADAKVVLWDDLARRMIRLAAQDPDEVAVRTELGVVLGTCSVCWTSWSRRRQHEGDHSRATQGPVPPLRPAARPRRRRPAGTGGHPSPCAGSRRTSWTRARARRQPGAGSTVSEREEARMRRQIISRDQFGRMSSIDEFEVGEWQAAEDFVLVAVAGIIEGRLLERREAGRSESADVHVRVQAEYCTPVFAGRLNALARRRGWSAQIHLTPVSAEPSPAQTISAGSALEASAGAAGPRVETAAPRPGRAVGFRLSAAG